MQVKYLFILIFVWSQLSSQSISIYENFSECALPQNWTFKTVNGSYGFSLKNNDQAYGFSKGCMISYVQSEAKLNSKRTFQLITPDYILNKGVNYYLVFNYRYVKPANASLSVSFQGPNGKVTSNIIPSNDFLPYSFSISSFYNLSSVKFTFEYNADVNDLGNQIYIDDILLVADNADCSRAQTLNFNNERIYGHSTPFSFYLSGGQSCIGEYQSAMWYKFTADQTGLIEIDTKAEYNNNINVFEDSCLASKTITCSNKDEFGFNGEVLELNVTQGKTYYIKLSRKINDFGKDNGLHSIKINKISSNKAKPINDICSQVLTLTINQACITGKNINADISSTLPSINQKSRADVWFKFTPSSTKPLQIITNANFAEVIALYKGTCSNLIEMQIEDFGNKLEFTPMANTEYFVQISGYFSTLEGDLCIEVKDQDSNKPVNDDCPLSTAINLNSSCNEIIFNNSSKSTQKPSCLVYNAPDVWYKFVGGEEKEVLLDVNAEFIYNWALYEGACNNLIELNCGSTPDPCDGPIKLKSIVSGKIYYLQIIASTVPLKPGHGKLCVRINEASKTHAFDKLRLNLNTECLHGVLSHIKNYTVTGGSPTYIYYGPDSDQYFKPGEDISAFVQDNNGCRSFVNTEALCSGGTKCKSSNLDLNVKLQCVTDSIGRQSGEVIISASGIGGSGAYYYYGTPQGTKLSHGDLYQVILIDSDSCFIIEEGKVNCPPFTCANSNLKLTASIDCIDTLLKAKVNLVVGGALGSFIITGTQDGDLLNQNDNYTSTVVDQAGCSTQLAGKINCKFDSCAYARPELQVSYKCITDSQGKNTGMAELIVYGGSRAGGEQFTGNRNGDTLHHGDKYKVVLNDQFGCSLTQEGEINCVITIISDQSSLKELSIVPNPTNEESSIVFYTINDAISELQLISSEGKIMMNSKIHIVNGKNIIPVNLSNLPSGIYFLQLQNEKFKELLKIVKI